MRGGQQPSILNRSTNFSLSNTAVWGLQGYCDTCLKVLAPYLPSTIVLERLKIWLAHTQFSRSATLWAYVTHVMMLDPRLPLFLSCTLKKIREPGDDANFYMWMSSLITWVLVRVVMAISEMHVPVHLGGSMACVFHMTWNKNSVHVDIYNTNCNTSDG